MRDFQVLCQSRHLRVTRQRLEVFRALIASPSHPSADEVWQTVRKVLPNISLDTVYRTLGYLESAGIVMKTGTSGGARFDGHLAPHHHFICVECGEIYDVPCPDEQSIPAVPENASQFGKVIKAHLQLRGICKRCLHKEQDVK